MERLMFLRSGDIVVVGNDEGFDYAKIAELCKTDEISLSIDENSYLVQAAFASLYDKFSQADSNTEVSVVHDHIDDSGREMSYTNLMDDLRLEQTEGHYGL